MRIPRSADIRLHYQIVLPLMVAAVCVGVVAALVAVMLLSDLTDQWVQSRSDAVDAATRSRILESADDLLGMSQLMPGDERFTNALADGDPARLSSVLGEFSKAVDADLVMLTDADGLVIAAAGGLTRVLPGDRPLGAGDQKVRLAAPHLAFLRINDAETVAAIRPVIGASGEHILVVADSVDNEFLSRTTRGSDAVFAIANSSGKVIARSSPVDDNPLYDELLNSPNPSVRAVVAEASAHNRGGPLKVKTSLGHYNMVATHVTMPGDPERSGFCLVSLVSMTVSDQARLTTERLITMWSAFAVLLLMGLGGWIARSVSVPLRVLSESAHRVADGDFTTKVRVTGSYEVRELGESFNAMTRSLRERTESLTKKVLELATLYEMSRSLGATLDLSDLLDSVLESALRIFDVESGYVSVRDRETGTLRVGSIRGPRSAEGEDRSVRSSMAEWVVREGRPLIFNPPADGSHAEVDSVTGAAAALSVPLATSEGVIGSITVGTHDPAFRFGSDDVRLLSTVANHVSIAVGNIELFVSLQDAYLATVRALAAAVDAKDPFTRGHSDGVAVYAMGIGEGLGLSTEQMTALEMAAYLHDIGKIGVREEILQKPGRLTESEMGQMRHHPLIGANILRPVAFPWPVAPVVRHHHEHWDGRGYPAGLKGEEIPLLARILSVADAYEAMISDRPYRKGRTHNDALGELQRCSGTQFDPRVVEAFIDSIDRARSGVRDESAALLESAEPDEVRAVFVAVCDGMLDSYRRLGGPRLSANLETQVNGLLDAVDLPFAVSGGHLTMRAGTSLGPEQELDSMRRAFECVTQAMEGTSGRGLVDHFYEEAVRGLSERMQTTTAALELRTR